MSHTLHPETGGPEHDFEPVPGLPAVLPEGEHIVWQGAPDWKIVLKQRLKLRWVMGYFLVIAGIAIWAGVQSGRSLIDSVLGLGLLGLAAVFVIAFMALFAWGVERTSLYTLTNKRLVMRVGVALSTTYNVPFKVMENVDLRTNNQGQGDIAIALDPNGVRLAWMMLWPHVRPWRLALVEPQLTGLKDANRVGSILSEQLMAWVARNHSADETSTPTIRAAGKPPVRPDRAASQSTSPQSIGGLAHQ